MTHMGYCPLVTFSMVPVPCDYLRRVSGGNNLLAAPLVGGVQELSALFQGGEWGPAVERVSL